MQSVQLKLTLFLLPTLSLLPYCLDPPCLLMMKLVLELSPVEPVGPYNEYLECLMSLFRRNFTLKTFDHLHHVSLSLSLSHTHTHSFTRRLCRHENSFETNDLTLPLKMVEF